MTRTLLAAAAVLALLSLTAPQADARHYGRHHHLYHRHYGFHHGYVRGFYATSDYYHRDRQLVGTR